MGINYTSKLGVIFDLDGLLVDSEPTQQKAMNIVLSKYGIELSENEFTGMVGTRTVDNFNAIVRKYGIKESVTKLIQLKDEAYRDLIKEELRAMPNALELVTSLKKQGIPMAVSSSSITRDIHLALRTAGLEKEISVIVGGENVTKGKPAPDIYILALERLKMIPEQCVALEDAGPGVEAAYRAGIKCIAAPNKYTYHHDFSHAVLIVDSLESVSVDLLRRVVYGEFDISFLQNG